MLKVFNLEPHDYKRLHAFLYGQHCTLPVGPYRSGEPVVATPSSATVAGSPSRHVDERLPLDPRRIHNRRSA
jgi:hypothetical protein